MGTSAAVHLSKSLSAVGTCHKVNEKSAQLGSIRSMYRGEQVQRSLCLTEGRRCLSQLPWLRLRDVGLGHPNSSRALVSVLSRCLRGWTCPHRGAGIIHKLEIFLRSFPSRSRCQVRQGSSWSVHTTAQIPSIHPSRAPRGREHPVHW